MPPERRPSGALPRAALLTALLWMFPAVAQAQADLARADSLLRRGRVASAESLLYRAVIRRPRDPAARLALGRYLAARGATRVGAVLIEEARVFGASPALTALHLAPLYARMNAWPSLVTLEGAMLTAGERQRARWLADNLPGASGADSTSIAYRPSSPAPHEAPSLGSIVLHLGADSLVAEIDPDARGLVVDRARAGGTGVRLFTGAATDERQHAGVIGRVRLGGITLTNVPVSFASLGASSRARVGLDFLARFAPTFDGAAGRATLRLSGRVSPAGRRVRIPLLLETRGSWVARDARLQPVGDAAVMRELLAAPWMLDGRRGEIVIGL